MDNPTRPLRLKWSALTHPGKFRKNNEDAFIALQLDAEGYQLLGKVGEQPLDPNDWVFAVSDGMGGANSGEFASRIAVEKLAELFPRNFRLGAIGIEAPPGDTLEELYAHIDEKMQQMAFHYEECRGMGATLSLGWFTPGRMHFAHAGDSRIYYLPKDGDIRQLTEDHTEIASRLRKGLISEYQAKNHPERHILYNVLGGKNKAVNPQIGTVTYREGDCFLFCSDGMTDGVRPHRIVTLLKSPPPRLAQLIPSERLFQDAIEESGRDNITVIVVEIQGEP